MKYLIFLILSIFLNGGASEYVCMMATRALEPNSTYNVFIAGSKVNDSKVIVRFGTNQVKIEKTNFSQHLTFNATGEEKKLKLLVGNRHKCQKVLIKLEKKTSKEFVTLIQLDTPVYQPGDNVRFLVLALTYDTKPFIFDDINVKVFNSQNKETRAFRESPKDFKFNGIFKIPHVADTGKWTIKVEINKNHVTTKKSFNVKIERPSLVKILMEVPSKVSIFDRKVTLNISATYFSKVYTSGIANILAKVMSMENDSFIIAQHEKKIKISGRENNVTFHFENDFDIRYMSRDRRILFNVSFHDDLTGNAFETSNQIILTVAGKYILRCNKKPFVPGHQHEFFVTVHTLDGKLINDRAMKVEMSVIYSHDAKKHFHDKILKNGVVNFIFNPHNTTTFIDIELKTGDSRDKLRIEASTEKDLFEIRLREKSYMKDRCLSVLVKSSVEMTSLNILVFSHEGLIYSNSFDSTNDKTTFNVKIWLQQSVLIGASVTAFFIKNDKLYTTSMKLPTKLDLKNDLSIKIKNSTLLYIPNTKITVVLNTTTDSFVSIMAVDQKIAFDGSHDMDEENLKKAITRNADSYENNYLFYNPELPCTSTEKRLFATQKTSIAPQSSNQENTIVTYEIDDNELSNDDNESVPIDTSKAEDLREKNEDDEVTLRKYFPDVWIYDNFITNTSTMELNKQLPDSITRWKLFALALHPEHGLSIAEPQFITTSKKIYLEVNAPRTVRRQEIFEITFLPMADNSTYDDKNIHIFIESKTDNFQLINAASSNRKRNCFNFTTSIETPSKITTIRKKVKFLIRMTKDGMQKINVTAKIDSEIADVVELSIDVIYDGIYEHESIEYLIDLEFDEDGEIDLNIPDRAELLEVGISLYGNLLGSTIDIFEKSLQDNNEMDGFLKFQQALIAHKYLSAIDKLNNKTLLKMVEVLHEEYASIIVLSSADGSFRRKEQETTHAIWFTSFIVQLLYNARNIIEVDDNLITDALNYLEKKQELDGSFPYENEAPHTDQIINQSDQKKFVTAYVAITFLKTYINPTVIDNSLVLLNNTTISNELVKSIAAYAFALAQENEKARELENDFKNNFIVKDVPAHQISLSSETAYYATLTRLKLKKEAKSVLPSIKYLVNKSKHFSKFDKIFAMEAICEYLIETKIGCDGTNMTVTYGGNEVNLTIADSSSSQHEILQIKKNDHKLSLTNLNGTGYALVNVWYNYVIRITSQNSYNIEANFIYETNELNVNVTANVNSFMPIIQIQIPSGYNYKFQGTPFKFNAKVQEIREDFLKISLDKLLANKPANFKIPFIKLVEFKNGNKVTVKVYQPNNPHHSSTKHFVFGGQKDCNHTEINADQPLQSTETIINQTDVESSSSAYVNATEISTENNLETYSSSSTELPNLTDAKIEPNKSSNVGTAFFILTFNSTETCIVHVKNSNTAITSRDCEISSPYNISAFYLNDKFSFENTTSIEINISVENKDSTTGTHQKMTLKNEIKSSPLVYKSDFTPENECKIIRYFKERLSISELDVTEDKLNITETTIITNLKNLKKGSLILCDNRDKIFYTMGIYDKNLKAFVLFND